MQKGADKKRSSVKQILLLILIATAVFFGRAGTANSVVILGAYTLLSAVLFALFTRKTAMAKEQ